AALVRVDGVFQRAFPLLELPYDFLKLCKRRLEAHRHDVRRDRRVGHSVAPAISSPELKHTATAKGKEDRLFQSISRKLAALRNHAAMSSRTWATALAASAGRS